jgi:hypothetical protein
LQASVVRTRRSFSLSAGAWTNVELSTHRDGSLSDLPAGDWGPSEYDFWAEIGSTFNGGDLAAGFVWYQYRGREGDAGTGEAYARYRGRGLGSVRVSPEISLWYDPVKRNSGYLEAGLTAPVLASPFLKPTALAYTALNAGFALGRPDLSPGLTLSSFRRSGFTHADLSAGIRARVGVWPGTLIANLAAHLMYANDSSTRRKSLRSTELSDTIRPYLSVELGMSWPPYDER